MALPADLIININDPATLILQYNQGGLHPAFAAAPPVVALAAVVPAPIVRDNGKFMSLGFKEAMLLSSPGWLYAIYDHLPSATIDSRLLGAGLAVAGVGAAAAYSPTVRKAIGFGARASYAVVKRTVNLGINFGVVAPSKALYRYSGSIGRGLFAAGSAGVNLSRRIFSGIGNTATQTVAGTIKVASNTIGEAGKIVGTAVESIGKVAPEVTGLAVTAAAVYFLGIPYFNPGKDIII